MRNVCNTHWHTPPERVERIEMESSSILKDSTPPKLTTCQPCCRRRRPHPDARVAWKPFIPCCFMPTIGTSARAPLPRCHQGQASRRRQAWRRCRWSPHCQAIRHQRSECQASTGLGDDGLNVILAVLDQGFLPGMNIAKVCGEFTR